MFPYIPKKSKEIYQEKIAHRGYHYLYPENTMHAFEVAIEKKLAIELDVRMTRDGVIVCHHDKSTKRLLGIKGSIPKMRWKDLKDYPVAKTQDKIPTLEEVLKKVDGKITLLIEVKSIFTYNFRRKLLEELKNYHGKVYFHTQNLITYYRLRHIWKDKVFFVLNPFRKRFDFIKTPQYKKLEKEENP